MVAPHGAPPALPPVPKATEASPLGWRHRLHEIIFESDTRAGRAFDVSLLVAVLLSVLAVMLESVVSIRLRFGAELRVLEWVFTVLFTVEYGLRLLALRHPGGYVVSFFGVVDLLSFLPTYLSALFPGMQALVVIRAFRVIRLFRIFKLLRHVHHAQALSQALRASRPKILVFLVGMAGTVVTMGAVIYLVEGGQNGFTSIPRSVYWAVVTVTTVGYGDMVPATPVGQAIAALAMITGYATIAVPTGIVSADLLEATRKLAAGQACPGCGVQGHDADALYCKRCATKL
jgi:voltage-gated potassium channel